MCDDPYEYAYVEFSTFLGISEAHDIFSAETMQIENSLKSAYEFDTPDLLWTHAQ